VPSNEDAGGCKLFCKWYLNTKLDQTGIEDAENVGLHMRLE